MLFKGFLVCTVILHPIHHLIQDLLSVCVEALSTREYLENDSQKDGALGIVNSDVGFRCFHTLRRNFKQHLNTRLILRNSILAIDEIVIECIH